MIKKNLKELIITSIVGLLPVIGGVVLWDRLPDQIPSHWNVAGEVDGWVSKPVAVFALPLIFIALSWLAIYKVLSDPKGNCRSPKMKLLTVWLIPVISLASMSAIYVYALGNEVIMELIAPVICGAFMIAIGNYLPKCEQNRTVGIKLPWTLANEENWNRTHRLAGFVFVIGGVLVALFALLGISVLVIVTLLAILLIPSIYSYILHRRGM